MVLRIKTKVFLALFFGSCFLIFTSSVLAEGDDIIYGEGSGSEVLYQDVITDPGYTAPPGEGNTSLNGGSVDNSPGSVSNSPGSVTNTGSGKLENLLQSKTIQEFLLKIVDVLLIFALPIIIFFIMYAGFLFVTAQGDTAKISTAKAALMWAVIGGVIVLGARAIITVITGTISAF